MKLLGYSHLVMNSMNAARVLLVVTLVVQPLAGQEVYGIPLRAKEVVPVELKFGALIVEIPVRCDTTGHVYFREYQQDFDASPIVRMSSEGKAVATFSIRKAPGFEEGRMDDLAIAPFGGVYILGAREIGKSHVVKFDADGEYDSSFELDPLMVPHRVAVFASGELLVAGEELSETDRKHTRRPILAIYDRSGRFLREISLPRDIELRSEAEQAEKGPFVNRALTQLASGDDGNVYLMRPGANPLVYVISPLGTVLKRLAVAPPGEHFTASTLKVAGGRIAVQFRRRTLTGSAGQEILSVVDVLSGEKVADYSSAPEIGGAWACYTGNTFTFLGTTTTDPVQMTLVHATPH